MTYYAMYDLTIFVCIYFFCFFKQKTAYEMRISDWSSDVCSSDLEEALAECRRVNIRLQQLSDKYHSERKYQRDAFIHNLMGIIYQSAGDLNNASIAYRNALEIYESDYRDLFSVAVPLQLKTDMLNAAGWMGFTDAFKAYQTRFDMHVFVPEKPPTEN